MTRIDINCDMGELPEAISDGTQESLMPFLTSVNIACGGHAGDASTMKTTIEQAQHWHLGIGAHPSYPDRENFGRLEMKISPRAIADSVFEQVRVLAEIAEGCGAAVAHVKPHGALYNQAAKDRAVAQAIADGVGRWRRDVKLVGLAESLALDVFRETGFHVTAEAFADRRYEADGSLRARKFDDALIHEPWLAAQQAVRIATQGTVLTANGKEIVVEAQTICIHGDTPGARQIAAAVAHALRKWGVELASLSHRT